MTKTAYPFQQTDCESTRLDVQFSLLNDPHLEDLLVQSQGPILDVGCGSGVVPSFLHSRQVSTKYTGLDIQETSVRSLRKKYPVPNFEFLQKDVTQFTSDLKYDLVVCRLVAWSIPDFLKNNHLKSLSNLLSEKGTLYFYEPDDTRLKFSPEMTSVRSQTEEWQQRMLSRGLNPFIGKELVPAIKSLAFTSVKSIQYEIVTRDRDANFEKTLKNLSRIYSLGDSENERLRLFENFSQNPDQKEITEAYYAIIATK